MSKAEETKQMIVARSAALFNQRGYSGTSISDVMEATGLKKGGIYNHFSGKDELALEAFDYAYGIIRQRYGQALLAAAGDPHGQLLAMLDVFVRNYSDPPVAGGCPVLNTAIDSDDAHPALCERARAALDEWQTAVVRIIRKGQARGRFRTMVDGAGMASLLVGTMEGALMMSRLYEDPTHVERARLHLAGLIAQELLL